MFAEALLAQSIVAVVRIVGSVIGNGTSNSNRGMDVGHPEPICVGGDTIWASLFLLRWKYRWKYEAIRTVGTAEESYPPAAQGCIFFLSYVD